MCVLVGNVSFGNFSMFMVEMAGIGPFGAVFELQQNFLKCELVGTFHIQEVQSCKSCSCELLGPKRTLPSKIKSEIASLCPPDTALIAWVGSRSSGWKLLFWRMIWPLSAAYYLGVKAEVCSQRLGSSGGLWKAAGELKKLLDRGPGRASSPASRSSAVASDSCDTRRGTGAGKKGKFSHLIFLKKVIG